MWGTAQIIVLVIIKIFIFVPMVTFMLKAHSVLGERDEHVSANVLLCWLLNISLQFRKEMCSEWC